MKIKRVTSFHSYYFSPEEDITTMSFTYVHRGKNSWIITNVKTQKKDVAVENKFKNLSLSVRTSK